jgi:hypothetical protein
MQVRELSQLSLPEVDEIVERVGQVAPAGNIPGVILNGLARLSGRRPPAETVRRDVDLLFKGVEKALDRAVYGAFFAGPAAVIWGYQNILKLAGKDPEDSFPEGVWQFYADYALREDTARHNNETHGFDSLLQRHQINLNAADRVTAWVMAALHCLHQYHDFLANEWRERKYIYLLQEVMAEAPDTDQYARLYRQWEVQRPYGRGSDSEPTHTYASYRRHKFERFRAGAMRDLTTEQRRQWLKRVQAASSELAAYQQQMSILAYLEPGPYGETRVPISLAQARLGLINQGRYYLVPACRPGTSEPARVETVRAQIASLMAQPTARSATQLSSLAKIRRAELADLWDDLNATLRSSLVQMRLAPILVNTDQRSRQLTLSELRQAERGIGNHALTVFDTGETFVFDQSHIFFDGAWGAALAEIMTQEALSWAVYLDSLPAGEEDSTAFKPLRLPFETAELRYIEQADHVTREVGVETEAVKLKPMLALRKLFKQRNDLIHLTVNDLLILYRAIHALTYQLDADLVAQLEKVAQKRRHQDAATAVLKALDKRAQVSPAVLIPVDATRRVPRDRVYPMVFEVPLADLDLLQLHQHTMAALQAYKSGRGDRGEAYADFDKHQRSYLASLAGFVTWAGLLLGPALALVAAIFPSGD